MAWHTMPDIDRRAFVRELIDRHKRALPFVACEPVPGSSTINCPAIASAARFAFREISALCDTRVLQQAGSGHCVSQSHEHSL